MHNAISTLAFESLINQLHVEKKLIPECFPVYFSPQRSRKHVQSILINLNPTMKISFANRDILFGRAFNKKPQHYFFQQPFCFMPLYNISVL